MGADAPYTKEAAVYEDYEKLKPQRNVEVL
jgi:hypothetical protein